MVLDCLPHPDKLHRAVVVCRVAGRSAIMDALAFGWNPRTVNKLIIDHIGPSDTGADIRELLLHHCPTASEKRPRTCTRTSVVTNQICVYARATNLCHEDCDALGAALNGKRRVGAGSRMFVYPQVLMGTKWEVPQKVATPGAATAAASASVPSRVGTAVGGDAAAIDATLGGPPRPRIGGSDNTPLTGPSIAVAEENVAVAQVTHITSETGESALAAAAAVNDTRPCRVAAVLAKVVDAQHTREAIPGGRNDSRNREHPSTPPSDAAIASGAVTKARGAPGATPTLIPARTDVVAAATRPTVAPSAAPPSIDEPVAAIITSAIRRCDLQPIERWLESSSIRDRVLDCLPYVENGKPRRMLVCRLADVDTVAQAVRKAMPTQQVQYSCTLVIDGIPTGVNSADVLELLTWRCPKLAVTVPAMHVHSLAVAGTKASIECQYATFDMDFFGAQQWSPLRKLNVSGPLFAYPAELMGTRWALPPRRWTFGSVWPYARSTAIAIPSTLTEAAAGTASAAAAVDGPVVAMISEVIRYLGGKPRLRRPGEWLLGTTSPHGLVHDCLPHAEVCGLRVLVCKLADAAAVAKTASGLISYAVTIDGIPADASVADVLELLAARCPTVIVKAPVLRTHSVVAPTGAIIDCQRATVQVEGVTADGVTGAMTVLREFNMGGPFFAYSAELAETRWAQPPQGWMPPLPPMQDTAACSGLDDDAITPVAPPLFDAPSVTIKRPVSVVIRSQSASFTGLRDEDAVAVVSDTPAVTAPVGRSDPPQFVPPSLPVGDAADVKAPIANEGPGETSSEAPCDVKGVRITRAGVAAADTAPAMRRLHEFATYAALKAFIRDDSTFGRGTGEVALRVEYDDEDGDSVQVDGEGDWREMLEQHARGHAKQLRVQWDFASTAEASGCGVAAEGGAGSVDAVSQGATAAAGAHIRSGDDKKRDAVPTQPRATNQSGGDLTHEAKPLGLELAAVAVDKTHSRDGVAFEGWLAMAPCCDLVLDCLRHPSEVHTQRTVVVLRPADVEAFLAATHEFNPTRSHWVVIDGFGAEVTSEHVRALLAERCPHVSVMMVDAATRADFRHAPGSHYNCGLFFDTYTADYDAVIAATDGTWWEQAGATVHAYPRELVGSRWAASSPRCKALLAERGIGAMAAQPTTACDSSALHAPTLSSTISTVSARPPPRAVASAAVAAETVAGASAAVTPAASAAIPPKGPIAAVPVPTAASLLAKPLSAATGEAALTAAVVPTQAQQAGLSTTDALCRRKVVIDGFHRKTLADEVRQLIKKDCKRDVATSITMAHRDEPDRVGGCFYAVVTCAAAADADLVVTKLHNRRWGSPRGLRAYPYASLSTTATSVGLTLPLPHSLSAAARATTATAAISVTAHTFPWTSGVEDPAASAVAVDTTTIMDSVGQTLSVPKSISAAMADRSVAATTAHDAVAESENESEKAMAEREAAVARAAEALRVDRAALDARIAAAAVREAALRDREAVLTTAQAASAALVAKLETRSARINSDRAQLATATAAFESREAAAAAAADLARADDIQRKAQLDHRCASLAQRATELDAREAAFQAVGKSGAAALSSIETTVRVLIADLFSDTASILADSHLETTRRLRAEAECTASVRRQLAALEAARTADASEYERALAALQSVVTQREADIAALQRAIAQAAAAKQIETEAALAARDIGTALANERPAASAAAVSNADTLPDTFANAAAAAERLDTGTTELELERDAAILCVLQ
jgi:hypothetical protein